MASYFLDVSIIKRSSGRSATAAAAYRAAERIDDERSGESHDYTRKGGVLETRILAPDDAPDWVQDRAALWNAVELAEKRKDAQVAREIIVALPRELEPEERRALVEDWTRERVTSRGMVADIAIHAPHKERGEDNDNHHAHILITTREISAEGFGKKNRDWNDREVVQDWRESWAEAQNRALERAGRSERVDHRSLEAQREEAERLALEAQERGEAEEAERQSARAASLDRAPEPRLGPTVMAMERKARRVAEQEGREYEPVTELGAALEQSRADRSMMDEVRARVEAARQQYEKVRDRFQRVMKSLLDRDHARAAEKAEERPEAKLAEIIRRGVEQMPEGENKEKARRALEQVERSAEPAENRDCQNDRRSEEGEEKKTAPERGRSDEPDQAEIVRKIREKSRREKEDRESGKDRDRD